MRDSIYGQSPELNSVLSSASLIAATDVTVLINGESGTGKELLAQAVHNQGPRRDRPFISVNCASLTDELADSVLYGHKRGAFTGAVGDHNGFAGAADGGTLFLDEIGEMPLGVQARFLRFLETGECQPVGAARPYQTDVRIVAATNRDLGNEVAAGRFRGDLYYRLNVVPLELPPLRQRSGDLELLLERLIGDLAAKHGLEPPRYTQAAIKVMKSYPWPGNIRELENTLERSLILTDKDIIDVNVIPDQLKSPDDNLAIKISGPMFTENSPVIPFEKLKEEVTSISDPEYINAKNSLSQVASSILGLQKSDPRTLIVSFSLVSTEMELFKAENKDMIPTIMSTYLIHNQSFLTDFKFLGFPFHYFYTAVFLLILFVFLCWLYCYRVDKMNVKKVR